MLRSKLMNLSAMLIFGTIAIFVRNIAPKRLLSIKINAIMQNTDIILVLILQLVTVFMVYPIFMIV